MRCPNCGGYITEKGPGSSTTCTTCGVNISPRTPPTSPAFNDFIYASSTIAPRDVGPAGKIWEYRKESPVPPELEEEDRKPPEIQKKKPRRVVEI